MTSAPSPPVPFQLLLLSFIYALVRLQLDLMRVGTRSAASMEMEIIALRHENAVLRRCCRRPRLEPIERLIFSALGRKLAPGQLPFSPATLLRWHRELVRRHWAGFGNRPRRPGRPCISEEIQQLILDMAKRNPRWGYIRIKGELLKLGHRISAATVRRLLRNRRIGPAPRRTGPTWRQFLRSQAGAIVACDFVAVDTILLSTFYVLVFIELRTRVVVWAACTQHPHAAWVAQQARNLVCELDDAGIETKFVIHDRDAKFATTFDDALTARSIRTVLTPFRSPRANSICERVLGSLRRECLDWIIIWGERHLSDVVREYFEHYNRARPHRSIELRPPNPHPARPQGEIVRLEVLDGLITEYSRAA